MADFRVDFCYVLGYCNKHKRNIKKMYKVHSNSGKNKKNKMLTATVIVILVIITCLAFYFLNNAPKEDKPPITIQPKYPVTQENQTTIDNTNSDKPVQGDVSAQTDQQVPTALEGSINVTELSQANGYINAKATIVNFTANKCVYSFVNQDARPVVRETSSGCDGISIPEVEFELIGTYNLTVTAYSETDKISTSKSIEIK